MPDATDKVQPSMLTRHTTLDEYLTFGGAFKPGEERPDIEAKLNERRREAEGICQDGDELWEWRQGPEWSFAAIGGLAIVRAGVVVKAWCDWRS